jgi:hypothetical protein
VRFHAAGLTSPVVGGFTSEPVIPDAVLQVEVMGPPDIERHTGLSGGHIFQDECLPEYMWDQRLKRERGWPPWRFSETLVASWREASRRATASRLVAVAITSPGGETRQTPVH